MSSIICMRSIIKRQCPFRKKIIKRLATCTEQFLFNSVYSFRNGITDIEGENVPALPPRHFMNHIL